MGDVDGGGVEEGVEDVEGVEGDNGMDGKVVVVVVVVVRGIDEETSVAVGLLVTAAVGVNVCNILYFCMCCNADLTSPALLAAMAFCLNISVI